MEKIIPYDSKIAREGGFIKPNGDFLYLFGCHESFARYYCNGNQYDFLFDIKYGSSYYSDHFDEFKKKYHFKGEKEDIDIYQSSKLTKEQLETLLLWLREYEFSSYDLYSDFLVFLLSFDKVEVARRHCITTTCDTPHIRFYNYYLMDWYIDQEVPMKYDPEKHRFGYVESNNWYAIFKKDQEMEQEINEIKANVLIKDRPLFFKD